MLFALAFAALGLQAPPAAAVRNLQERLAQCGVDAGRVAVRHERALQSEVVFIAGAGVPPDATLACVAAASADTGVLTRFDDPDADTRYGDAWAAVVARRARDMARRWLAERGRLEALPAFDPQQQTLAEFGARLEAFCGTAAGTGLRVEAGILTLAGPKNGVPRLGDAQRDCIVNAASAAGVGFGFLVYEAASAGSGGKDR
ncbi:MAG TPA: hypothetical protein VGB79_11225 [Allosphingosinicella sp.]|jgi:hypothetical protein